MSIASAADTTAQPQTQPPALEPSELGTREYWDNLYNLELQNHDNDNTDEGQIWFSESNAEAVVLRHLDSLVRKGLIDKRQARILDLGTGNGHLLFVLRDGDEDGSDDEDQDGGMDGDAGCDDSWAGEMVGVDYSAASIGLARQIARQRERSHQQDSSTISNGQHGGDYAQGNRRRDIRFELYDILTPPTTSDAASEPDWLKEAFDIVLDKGTFDAISLTPTQMSVSESGCHPCEIYRTNVTQLVRPGGFLVITSCNWTREELVQWLAPGTDAASAKVMDGSDEVGSGEGGLRFYDEAKYPTFTFGGKKGQSVVTVVFRRQSAE